MTLPEICIRRPVFATVLSLAILLVGIISYNRLPVREYPKIDEPIVTVETTYRGASADVMESQVTRPLEDSLSGIEGVDVMTSTSRAEVSSITVRFKLSRDPDGAAADVRDKVSRVRGRLPTDIDEPVISKTDADAFPIMWIALASDRHSRLETSDYAARNVRPRLQTLPGAADVRIFGERRISMRVWLDRAKLAGYRLTVQDVEDAIRRQNVEIPAGRIESRKREFSVLSQTDLQTPAEFGGIVIREVNGYAVRLRDIAKVEVAPASERIVSRYNGNPSVSLGLIRQSTANALDLSVAAQQQVKEINKTLPEGMKLIVSFDSAVFIQESISSVFRTILEAIVLVALVIFLFLRDWRATVIPLVTIPVSLIGAFTMMYIAGFSINTLTLLAMVLAIGLVVDDAIVVLENIYRNMEQGMNRLQAALVGAREMAFAVIAMTITLAAVYAPLAFSTGRTGRLFTEFALALAGAVLVSGFVALTLSPMMCSQMLRHQGKHGALYNAIESFFNRLTESYRRSASFVLSHRPAVIAGYLGVIGLMVFLALQMKSELAPIEDRSVIFGPVSAPEGSTVAYTAEYMQRIEEIYKQVPEGSRFFTMAGNPTPDNGFSLLILKPWSERTRSQQEIAKELGPKLFALPGIMAFPLNPPSLGGSRGSQVQFVLLTQASYPELQRMVERLIDEARKNPKLINVDTDLKLNQPEVRVSVNRDKASDLGVPIDTVGRTLESMLGGRVVTRFKQEGEQYDVIVQVADTDRSSPNDISDIYVRSRNNEMVQLSNLLSVREGVSPKNLNHFNKLRSATITANLVPGYSLGEALKFMADTSSRVLPNVVTDYAGPSREFKDSAGSAYLTFALALIFIYLVLAAQFESFVDPFVIMLTVPLSMTGALAALLMTGGTLNVYSQIGLVTLVGLITKHGILIVEFANQLQEKGHSIRDAVIEAAVLRLRPILMTTGAMVLGAVPLAIATGAGAESRQQIGWVIVGGLLVGTVLTLFVVPVAYTLLAARHKTFEQKLAEQAAQGAPANAQAGE
ncbi:MAG: efflux RND transporter permease subunit [Burkholderiales bacterium]|nr:efflux RND transporter permease subunit [Burkholderiales bacterium]